MKKNSKIILFLKLQKKKIKRKEMNVFHVDIEKETVDNTDYRRVINTPGFMQLVLMSIPVGEDIELEMHPNVDQFFRIEKGEGKINYGKRQENSIRLRMARE